MTRSFAREPFSFCCRHQRLKEIEYEDEFEYEDDWKTRAIGRRGREAITRWQKSGQQGFASTPNRFVESVR